ncbi:hypothetical protein [Enterocloster citroniae]
MRDILNYLVEIPLSKKSEGELRDIIGWHYIGDILYANLHNRKVIKLELISEKTFKYGDCIQDLTATVINKSSGVIDQVRIPFMAAFKSSENKYLKVKTDSSTCEWSSIPSDEEIDNLANIVLDYINLWS